VKPTDLVQLHRTALSVSCVLCCISRLSKFGKRGSTCSHCYKDLTVFPAELTTVVSCSSVDLAKPLDWLLWLRCLPSCWCYAELTVS